MTNIQTGQTVVNRRRVFKHQRMKIGLVAQDARLKER
jgi:hypothetical protein